jgi:hypothetical protein
VDGEFIEGGAEVVVGMVDTAVSLAGELFSKIVS